MVSPVSPAVRRRRLAVLSTVAVVLLVVLGVVAFGREEADAPTDVTLDAWVPFWVADRATADLPTRSPKVREVSPFWFQATGATAVGIDPNASTAMTDAFLSAARAAGLQIVPSVVDAMPAGGMAGVLADPTTRSQHVEALVQLATSADYAGLDIDYEKFAFADGRATWATTRPNWVAFLTELAGRLHERGLTLTVSVPPVYDDERNDPSSGKDSGYWVYDYEAMAEVVDRIRVMVYDYAPSTPGPIAPLEFVERAIRGTKEASGAPEKLVLGFPLYGYNWPTTTTGTCPADAESGRTSVSAATVDELLQRRGGTPVFDEDTGEWSFTYQLEFTDGVTTCTQTRVVHYVDGDGARLRIQMAREAQFGGVAVWGLGFDDDAAWAQIDPVVVAASR